MSGPRPPRCLTVGCELLAEPRSRLCLACELAGRETSRGRRGSVVTAEDMTLVQRYRSRRASVERIEAYSLHPLTGPPR